MSNPHGSSLFRDVVRAIYMTTIAVLLVIAPRFASAHAVLLHSSPSAHETLRGPDVVFALQFNSRVDAGRSSLVVTPVSGAPTTLVLEKQTKPDTVTAHVPRLAPGEYVLRWQALSTDGHITRGQIPFRLE